MASPSRVLLIDDDTAILAVVGEGLAAEGFDVAVAGGAREAIAALGTQPPFDALVVDEEMPGLTGRRLVRSLRSRGVTTPVVLHSGSLQLTAEALRELSAHCVVAKPARLEALAAAIREAILAGPARQ